jgi:TrmH family RNA methyltransferase
MKHKFISAKNNALIIEICKLKQKKHRDRTGLFYVEGVKLLNEALNSGLNIRYIIAVGDAVPSVPPNNIEIITVTPEVYKKITDEEAFQGVMCVIEKSACVREPSYTKPVIILNSVRDPGNVGTIIRTANALCDADMILSDDCADIYSGKTQRAAMGAVFRQNIKISGDIIKDIANLKENGYNIFAAHLDKDACFIDKVKFDTKTAVIFGNEGIGLNDKVTQACDEKVIIPINQGSESLNVSAAAGIILWEMRKGLE